MKLTLVQAEIEQAVISYMRQTVFTGKEDMPIRCSFSTTRNPITVIADIDVDIFGKNYTTPTDEPEPEKKSTEVEDNTEETCSCGPNGCHIDWDTSDPNEVTPEKAVTPLFNDMTMPINK